MFYKEELLFDFKDEEIKIIFLIILLINELEKLVLKVFISYRYVLFIYFWVLFLYFSLYRCICLFLKNILICIMYN